MKLCYPLIIFNNPLPLTVLSCIAKYSFMALEFFFAGFPGISISLVMRKQIRFLKQLLLVTHKQSDIPIETFHVTEPTQSLTDFLGSTEAKKKLHSLQSIHYHFHWQSEQVLNTYPQDNIRQANQSRSERI